MSKQYTVDYSLTTSTRKKTPQGFIISDVVLAKAGILRYKGSEIGRTDEPDRIFNVYRPPEELFKKETMDSFKFLPLTIDHVAMVDEDNLEEIEQGSTTENVYQEKDLLKSRVIFRTKKAKKAIDSELSIGFYTEYDFTPGKTPEGEDYDAVQTAITGNHVALVTKGRCGGQCRVLDSEPNGDNPMKKQLIRIGSTDCELDENVAHKVEFAVKALDQEKKDLQDQLDKVQAQLDSANEELKDKKKELESLEKKTSAEAMDSAINSKLNVIKSALKVQKDFDYSGKTENEIRREIVSTAVKDSDFSEKSDAYIEARFDSIVENIDNQRNEDEDLGNAGRRAAGDSGQEEEKDERQERIKALDEDFILNKLGD